MCPGVFTSDWAVTAFPPGTRVERSLIVYGLATVAMTVDVAVELANILPSTLKVWLRNPSGTEAIVGTRRR